MTHVPYGYRIEASIAVIYEPEAEKIRKFFAEYLDCKSMRSAGIKAGIEKTHSVLGRILKCDKYLGTDFYPAIIDTTTYDEAQKIRELNAKQQNRIRDYAPDPESKCTVVFKAEKAEQMHDDPYKQAEYAYELIQEEPNE